MLGVHLPRETAVIIPEGFYKESKQALYILEVFDRMHASEIKTIGYKFWFAHSKIQDNSYGSLRRYIVYGFGMVVKGINLLIENISYRVYGPFLYNHFFANVHSISYLWGCFEYCMFNELLYNYNPDLEEHLFCHALKDSLCY